MDRKMVGMDTIRLEFSKLWTLLKYVLKVFAEIRLRSRGFAEAIQKTH